MSDSFNTAVVVTTTLQNQVLQYDLTTLAYLTMVEWAGQGIGIYCYWFVQRKFNLSTKTMFNTIAVFSVLMDIWGMVGIWTQMIGFHRPWEFWLFQAWLGLFVSPYYSYSQIMVSRALQVPDSRAHWSLLSNESRHCLDLRSDPSWERIPFLLLLQHRWNVDLFHRPGGLQRHHRCLPDWKRLFALLLLDRYEPYQFSLGAVFCGSGEEQKGAEPLFGKRKSKEGAVYSVKTHSKGEPTI